MDDCLIVGGGVVGLSLAYELAHCGLRVRVVDRGQPGREASWAGAGILPPANPATAEHPLEQLRGLSHQLHPLWAQRLQQETGIDTGYRRCGGIYVARTPGEAAALIAWAESLGELEIDARRLSGEELGQCEPALRELTQSRQIRAAYLLPDEAQLRNPRHLQALQTACARQGVMIEGEVGAVELIQASGRLEGVLTSAGLRQAAQYCLCAGAWTYELLRQLHVSTGILPIRGQMVLFRGDSPPFRYVLNEGSRYLVPRDDGYVLAGSTEEEVGFDKEPTQEGIRELTQFAYDLVPELKQFRIERTWAGLRPGSFDGFPYLGAVPGFENVFAAAGHFRSGLHLSTGTAVVLGQLLRGETPAIDLTPFRVGRG